jgi:hypothetical protein
MAKIFTNDGVLIAKVMRDHLNSWTKRPTDFKLEDLGKKVPSLMIQQLSAAEKKRTYINGSYIGVWNFAVYIRINALDTSSRLDAISCLEELSKWLQSKNNKGEYVNLPFIDLHRTATQIEMTTTPSIAARYDDGTEDYQAIFSLEYQATRRI